MILIIEPILFLWNIIFTFYYTRVRPQCDYSIRGRSGCGKWLTSCCSCHTYDWVMTQSWMSHSWLSHESVMCRSHFQTLWKATSTFNYVHIHTHMWHNSFICTAATGKHSKTSVTVINIVTSPIVKYLHIYTHVWHDSFMCHRHS